MSQVAQGPFGQNSHMEKPRKDIDQLQQEIDQEREGVKKASRGDRIAKHSRFDAVITGAGLLVVVGLALSFAKTLDDQTVSKLTAGSIGGAAGLLIGFAVGRSKPE